MSKWFKSAAFLALLVSIGLYSKQKFCGQYPTHQICAVPFPTPEPTVAPTATPSPVPEPTALPTVTPSPVPTATPPSPTPPPAVGFPVRFPAATASLYMRNHRYGNGIDSTPRIRGDRELCELLHHVPVPSGDCHFDSDVWTGKTQRADYEGLVLAGARHGGVLPSAPLGPVWEYRAGGQQRQCRQREDGFDNTSCDHFGSAYVDGRDDPKTPEFEGEPKWLANQRDEYGPYAGFFMVPQTSGPGFGTQIRACIPGRLGDIDTCGPWLQVDWK